jgi:chromosome segregation protein
MKLKRLELKGFKSFANETAINFEENVIGIVGPNGSGKSNIVDAIRWVLGEQKNKELRLDQMANVIFNGAKNRKPGAMAQVSLTFENTQNLLPTEYNSVVITRILYRSGESEYRLNNVPCRLKDITSLFLDTGIGSNSYAIIALGMVDDILSDKDHSRRRMFEQAAGVSKYKIRKRETLNKLQGASADLERVEDLLFEIEGNLKTLEKQAKRARRYLELKAEYKQLNIDLAAIRIAEWKEKRRAIETQLSREEIAYRDSEVLVLRLEAQLEAEKKASLDKEKALSESQRELNQWVGQIRGLENDRRMAQQRRQFVEQNQVKLDESIRHALAAAERLSEEIERFRQETQAEKRLEAGLEAELDAAKAYLENIRQQHGAIKAELDEVVGAQQNTEREIFELEKRKAVYVNQIDNSRQEIARNEHNIQQRREALSELEAKLGAAQTDEAELKARLQILQADEARRQTAREEAEKQMEAVRQGIAKANRDLDARRNEYKLTESMIENLEGFPESIRFLSASKEWDNQTPLLSDLMYVREDYRVAIENYLDPYLNYFVARDKEEAYRAIALLSRSQKGKANFFLLDAFDAYVAPIALLPDTLRAIDLVETEPAYRNLCSYLLENVLITENEDLAAALPDDSDLVLLSRSGRVIRRRYSLSGGSIGLFEGKKIGRKKNLEVLAGAIKKAEKESDRLSAEYFQLKDRVESLRQQQTPRQIQELQGQISRLAQEIASTSARLENSLANIEEGWQREMQLRAVISEREADIAVIDAQLAEQNAILAEVKSGIANADSSFRQVAEQLSQASSAYNDKNIACIRQQNKVAALQRELAFREKELAENLAAAQANRQQIQTTGKEIERINDELEKLEEQLGQAYAQRRDKETSLSSVEQEYFQARGVINDLEDALRKAMRARQEQQTLVNELKEKFSEVKFGISAAAQRLQIEFDVRMEELVEHEPELPLEELAGRVEKLKSRLDNYGEINPMAVEAYEEIKERHEAISRQRDDILQAKEALLQTIKEIEETATQQFLAAFERVRLHFIEVFRSLFTEDDNCDLILLNPQDPLESDLEIVAKPKGKRPQTINQLSGGEKTLTAIALLFALYLLKPAPFCVFDEVDAPLDDANILKFNKIVKHFAADSQFIIVTHNKLTMAAVDTIYGVYMAEQGVSGVTEVNFRDFDHPAAAAELSK